MKLPFFAISGASGVGKSTTCKQLPALVQGLVVLDADLFWRQDYWGDACRIDDYYRMLLRLAVAVARSGTPLVLGGAVHPQRWEGLPERAELTAIHYLALVAAPEAYEQRLLDRDPDVRADAHFTEHLSFNRWLRANGAGTDPPMTVLDTTGLSVGQTSAAAAAWLRSNLSV